MNKDFDIIVIGAGHNGLTTACTLAKQGKKVLVLEQSDHIGGLAASEEFHPGYRTTGTLHDSSQVRTQVIDALKLKQFGLETDKQRPKVGLLSDKGDKVQISSSLEETVEAIAKFSKKDADAYRYYQKFIGDIRPFINSLMNEQAPDLINLGGKQLFALAKKALGLRKLGKKTMLEFLKVAPMSVADYLNETFETEFIKSALTAPAIYGSFNGPWSSYTTLNLLIWECAAQEHIKGGPQALVVSLEKMAAQHSVEIRTNSEVRQIMINDQGEAYAVKLADDLEISANKIAASCTAHETFLKLIPSHQVEYSLEHAITHFRNRGTTAKLNIALNEQVSIDNDNSDSIQYYRTGNSFDDMEKAFDPIKYNELPDHPILDICLINDVAFAPSGHAVMSVLIHFVPYALEGGWTDKVKNDFTDKVINQLENFCPDLGKKVLHTELLSPVDLEEKYHLTAGNIYHGEHAVDQLITRPIPALANYKTSFKNLYLCGSASHPGGGITAMPGHLAAKKILSEY